MNISGVHEKVISAGWLSMLMFFKSFEWRLLFPIDILGSSVSRCESAKNLGVQFDLKVLPFPSHISILFRACFINIRLCRVRRYQSLKAATKLANTLVSNDPDF